MVYYSQLKNNCVYDSKNVCVGRLSDLVFVDGKNYAEITHLIYRDEDKYKKKIPWDYVQEFKEGKDISKISIFLNTPDDQITPFFMKKKESLVGGILDKQVIDVNGVKIVRVNDIILGKIDKKFCIVAVGVGATSFIRRLGINKLTQIGASRFKEQVIPWKSVERVEAEFHDLHLKIQKDKITDLHPEDIADIMEDLSHKERILIFNSLTDRKAAKTLIEAEEEVQDSVLKSFKLKKIKDLLENIPTDQAADIISLMPDAKGQEILKSMRIDTSKKIRKILNYYPEAIGAIMSTEFISIPKDYTAQKTISMLRKMKPRAHTMYHLYVVDTDRKLIGILSNRSLLIANPSDKVGDFMQEKVVAVQDNSPTETAARLMARYDLFILPVVDKNHIMRGIVKADDVLDEYIPERQKREKFLPLKLRQR
ncbi:MAG: CBS domain-containing protein [Nanoarchaeota archaeon]